MKTSEELHEERARPFPAPGAQQDICWLGWPPGPRAHPTAALRLPQALQPRRTGVDVPRAAVAGTIGSVCHVPALVPFCSMASPPRAVVAASVLAPLVGFLGTRGLSASHTLLERSDFK